MKAAQEFAGRFVDFVQYNLYSICSPLRMVGGQGLPGDGPVADFL